MTVEGRVLSTPAYISPELADHASRDIDVRADIYSLGVILFELLTGERPFRGKGQVLLQQIIHNEAPRLRKLNGHIPPDLETICLKCLEKNPDRRYESAVELAADLRRWQVGWPIHARPIPRSTRACRWFRRNRVAVILGGSAIIILLAGMVVAAFLAGKAGGRQRIAPQQTNAAHASL